MMHDGSPEFGKGRHVEPSLNMLTTLPEGVPITTIIEVQALNALLKNEQEN